MAHALTALLCSTASESAREMTKVLSQVRLIYEGETEKPTPHHFHPIVMERHDAIVATASAAAKRIAHLIRRSSVRGRQLEEIRADGKRLARELARLDRSRRHFRRAAATAA